MGVEYSNMDPKTRKLIEQVQANRPDVQSLAELKKLSESMTTLGKLMMTKTTKDEKAVGDIAELLFEIRDGIDHLTNVEVPDSPDYAKPVVGAVKGLETALTKAIRGIDVSPQVAAPNVKVEAPKLDLSGVEKLLKTEVPKAFKEAISLIPTTEVPETDLTPLTNRFDEILERLQSIDTATRMKPINAGLTNTELRATALTVTDQPLKLELDESNAAYFYLGTAPVGSAKSAAVWRIRKIDQTTGLDDTWADGDSNYDNIWDNRSGLTYS